jgi:ATP/ADP translocase
MVSKCSPQSRETFAADYALFSAFAIIAQQIACKAPRDSLFLSYFGVTDLPKIVITGGLTSILAVMIMSKLLSRYGPASLIPVVFTMSGLLHVSEWFLYKAAPEIATLLLYVHVAVFSAILISGFWSVVNERFNPYSAKRTVARITVGATLGGLVGGVMVERVSALTDLQVMLLVLAGLQVVCGFGVLKVGEASVPQPSSNPVMGSGSRELLRTPYLLQMVALMILTTMVCFGVARVCVESPGG